MLYIVIPMKSSGRKQWWCHGGRGTFPVAIIEIAGPRDKIICGAIV